ncbi:MAG: hypothetical protein ACYC8T_20400, partial [Myxococcaceae bacterium]
MSRSTEMVELVSERLGPLRKDVVFLGGAVTALLITDPAAPEVRVTADVDVIVDIASHVEYARLAGRLRALGFKEDRSQGAPVCRWVVGGVILDVMPTAESVLGFANRWYPLAVQSSQRRKVGRHYIRLVSPPLFLATKFEAFDGRGRGDYRASHDLNDIIAVVDGRREVVAEITA